MNTCRHCQKPFEGITAKKKYVNFCSDSCYVRDWQIKNPEKHQANQKNSWRARRKDHKCCICGFDRTVDFCHIIWKKDGGGLNKQNITILCPNHHRLYDSNSLTQEELSLVRPVSKQ